MSWDCPNCGHKGNEKNFCGMCGCAKPDETLSSNVAETDVEPNAYEKTEDNEKKLPNGNAAEDNQLADADVLSADNEIIEEANTEEAVDTNEAAEDAADICDETAEKAEYGNDAPSHAVESAAKDNLAALKSSLGKKRLLVGVVGALLAIMLIFYGTSQSNYQKNCDDFVVIMNELDQTVDKISELPGDATDTERKTAEDDIQRDIDKLESLGKDIKKSVEKQSKNQKHDTDEDFYALGQLVDYEVSYLQSIKSVIAYCGEDTGDLSHYVSDEYRQISKNYVDVYSKYSGLSDVYVEYKDKKTGKKSKLSAKELLRWNSLDSAIVAYANRKSNSDANKLASLRTKARDKVQENNEELKKKGEVVFLVDNVYAGPNGNIVINGEFYNGTQDVVSNVKEALVDVSLKAYDNEVFYIKDENVKILSGPNMSPGATSKNMNISINVKDKVKDGKVPYFTTADVSVHKIRWVVRKLVKR